MYYQITPIDESASEPVKIEAVNTQGYFAHEVNRFLNNHKEKPDVLICTEHKQRDWDAIHGTVPGYSLAAGYRATTGQRGTALLVRDGVDYQRRHDLDSFRREETFEAASVEVRKPGASAPVVVTGVYRSPNSRLTEHNRTLDSMAKYMKDEPDKIHVIGGDLNVDLTASNSTSKVLKDNNLNYHIRSATHDKGKCLDNFITSAPPGFRPKGRRLTSSFSDHRPIQLTVDTTPSGPSSRGRRRRSSNGDLISTYFI